MPPNPRTDAPQNPRNDASPKPPPSAPPDGAPGSPVGGGNGGTTALGSPVTIPDFQVLGAPFFGGGRSRIEQLVAEACGDGTVCLTVVPVPNPHAGSLPCEIRGFPAGGTVFARGADLPIDVAEPCDGLAAQTGS